MPNHHCQHHAQFANSVVTARITQGFMATKRGWMPFLGEIGLLSVRTGADGLFATREEALQAGEAFRRHCQSRIGRDAA
ncbi:MAG: hypothetical protein HQL99_13195 [Magnetococcales bacterium]|nr:hypothetical protein [Magnetococcales bacterium]